MSDRETLDSPELRDDVETIASFIVGWWPALEDPVYSSRHGGPEQHPAHDAARRVLDAIRKQQQEPDPTGGYSRDELAPLSDSAVAQMADFELDLIERGCEGAHPTVCREAIERLRRATEDSDG